MYILPHSGNFKLRGKILGRFLFTRFYGILAIIKDKFQYETGDI
jgi:hypothetical protein